jgi:hypothetical protein
MTDFPAQMPEAAKTGIIDYDPAKAALYCLPALYNLLGLSRDLGKIGSNA